MKSFQTDQEQNWDDAATHVSKVTEETEEPTDTDVAPELPFHEEALLHADPKKSARQKVRENTGRNRRRGGAHKKYFERWAYEPDLNKRKFQSMWNGKKESGLAAALRECVCVCVSCLGFLLFSSYTQRPVAAQSLVFGFWLYDFIKTMV